MFTARYALRPYIKQIIFVFKRLIYIYIYIYICYFHIPYILESNPHPFYSFRGLKNQMRIIIACGLDPRSRAGFWKNDRAAVRVVRTIQYKNFNYFIYYSLL